MNGPSPAPRAATIHIGEDMVVSRMGFGARWIAECGPEDARALLARALELGVDFIDTADVYGDGRSEEVLREVLHPYPSQVVIATKGGQIKTDAGPRPNGRPEHLRSACEASLRRLAVDAIDLYQLHSPDPDVPIEESMGALEELRNAGKVRQVGVSNLFRARLSAAASISSIATVQNLYSIADRTNDPDVDWCQENGTAFVPYFPLGAGSLAAVGGAVATVAQKHHATPAQVSLAWLLHRSNSILPIPGTRSVEHLEENVMATSLALTADDRALLESKEASEDS